MSPSIAIRFNFPCTFPRLHFIYDSFFLFLLHILSSLLFSRPLAPTAHTQTLEHLYGGSGRILPFAVEYMKLEFIFLCFEMCTHSHPLFPVSHSLSAHLHTSVRCTMCTRNVSYMNLFMSVFVRIWAYHAVTLCLFRFWIFIFFFIFPRIVRSSFAANINIRYVLLLCWFLLFPSEHRILFSIRFRMLVFVITHKFDRWNL